MRPRFSFNFHRITVVYSFVEVNIIDSSLISRGFAVSFYSGKQLIKLDKKISMIRTTRKIGQSKKTTNIENKTDANLSLTSSRLIALQNLLIIIKITNRTMEIEKYIEGVISFIFKSPTNSFINSNINKSYQAYKN